MFVHPGQVGEIARRHPSIKKARLIIERPASADVMTLHVETTGHIETAGPEGEDAAIVESIQVVTKLRGGVARVPAGSLPDDGKLIEDRRPIG